MCWPCLEAANEDAERLTSNRLTTQRKGNILKLIYINFYMETGTKAGENRSTQGSADEP